MKLLCNREKLREGLSVANTVIPAKSPKPVMSNVCLVAREDALELVGCDADTAVRYRIEDVKVEEPGMAVVPARVILDFVRDLAGETVVIDTSGGNCQIHGGQDTCELVTGDPDEFPVVSRSPEEGALSIQGGTFSALVGRTAFAAAREQGRYAMNGVLVEVENGSLKMVATDGRRLAVAHAPIEASAEGSALAARGAARPAIVPTKAMQLFCRVISDPLESVKLHISDNQVSLKTRTAEVFARLLDGEFPRYAAVIPLEAQNVLEADADTLGRKIRLVANVTGDEARAVRLSLRKAHLELFGHSAGRGEARASMDVDFRGAPSDIAFNPDYVVEGLKNCESTNVRLEFHDRTSPGKFTLGESYIYIVMPITVDV
jgi:DNA polymerase-3 subunit beta